MPNSYTTSFELNSSPENVFEAISKKLGDWWGKQDQSIEKAGSLFTVSWGEPWYQFKVLNYVKNQEMVWECIDANQKIEGLTGVEKEWVGTKIHWKLVKLDEGHTLLDFKHEGLIPAFLCFDFCTATWNRFLTESLVNYLTK